MAKDEPRIKILIRSAEGSATVYRATKNRRTTLPELDNYDPDKYDPDKYDPKLYNHVISREVGA